jgi:hypothetical protein
MVMFVLCLVFCGPAIAQSTASADKSIQAVYTEVPPELDGVIDDWAWLTATIVENLHVVSPNEGDVPSERSRFYVTYDNDAIYVAAELFDTEPDKITARVLRQGDYSEGEDGVMLILDPFHQGRSGYAFYLTVNAVRFQALYKNSTEENWNWGGIWHGVTRRTEFGWTAEIEIPLQTLSFDPGNDTWGINFTRYIGRRTEEIGWVSHNRRQNPANSGEISGLQGLKQGLGIEFVPALVVGENRDYVLGETGSSVEPSLDVTYKPTPALTATLTLNTDFSGTSADLRQVNLTRFDEFFPEKRKFFLQDMDIFEFGRIGDNDDNSGGGDTVERETGRPFFSRRIGLADDGEAIDIDGGLKLSGRVGRLDYGFLGIRQGTYGTVDARDLFAARLSANVLEESAVGVIATLGDPASNEDNSLVGVDFRYLNTRIGSNKTLDGAAWIQQTDTPGLDGDDLAYGFSLNAPNSVGWSGALSFRELQRNYRPALGFVSQVDVRSLLFGAAYIWRPESNFIRSIRSGLRGARVETLAGELDRQQLDLDLLRIDNHTGDNIRFSVMDARENLTAPFEISAGVFIPTGAYHWTRYCLRAGTGQHRSFSLSGWACDGDFYDGTRKSVGPELVWRPSMHFSMAASYQVNSIDLPYGSFITRQATLQADIAFTSTWYWENLVQYDNVSDSLGINSIMRWIPLAGREFVLVLNRELLDPGENGDFVSSYGETVLRFHYTFRY